MKKIQNWVLTLVAFVTMGLTFTSCDDDIVQARYLSGEWRGYFGMYYVDRFGYEWDSEYTIIEFYRDPGSSHGWGRQYDKYSHAPISYEYHKFNWRIDDGIVYLTYPGDHQLDTWIRDYEMDTRVGIFTGYFENSKDRFHLVKYADFEWRDYDRYGDYGYNYIGGFTYGGYTYDDYYIFNSKAMNGSIPEADSSNIIVKHGNRYAEGNK